jgi:hypothetical protein
MLRRTPLLRGAPSPAASSLRRAFRSVASIEAILSYSHPSKTSSSSEDQAGPAHLALYNYPTFAGAYSALAADLFHRRLGSRLLILPFSSIDPLRSHSHLESHHSLTRFGFFFLTVFFEQWSQSGGLEGCRVPFLLSFGFYRPKEVRVGALSIHPQVRTTKLHKSQDFLFGQFITLQICNREFSFLITDKSQNF